MRTITVKLPKGLAERIDATVRRRGTTTSALVREALEERLGATPDAPRTCRELCADLEGSLSGPADLSSNANRLKGYGR